MKDDLTDFIEASGLNQYDPLAIEKIYQGNPSRLIKRLWQTLMPIGVYLFKVLFDKLIGRLKNETKARQRAKEFTDLLVKLGPAFIKGGQALSTRPDIVPRILLEELSQLQDQLPGFNSDLAMACIEEDLESPIIEIFEDLEADPISAASLGQVHKGILKNGDKVAVKVQRPGLREQITLDLYIVRKIASWLNKYIGLIRSDLVALIDELGKRVFEEMDYLNEAKNGERFKKNHEHNKKIAVPKIYKHASSRRVLTMEWIDGVKLTNLDAVKKLGIEPAEMVDIGVNCSLEQLLEHGFFHADPHPGNLLALEDGRLCYLDFGMMSEVTRESRTGLIQAVVHLVNKRFNELSKDFVKLGFLSKEIDLEPIVPAFESVFSEALKTGVNNMDFKSVTDDMSGVMYKFPFKVPAYYALIIRSLITLEGIALSVDPNFKILGAAYPYFARRLMEDEDPELRKSLKEMLFDGENFKWQRFNDLLSSATNQKELNIDNLADQMMEFIFSSNGGIFREQLVNIIVDNIDEYSWKILKEISYSLPITPTPLKIKKETKEQDVFNLEPIKSLFTTVQKMPSSKQELILNKIVKLIKEPLMIEMSKKVAKGVAERSIVRFVKVAAGVSV